MSRGPYPIMLMLAMSLPGAVKALGLGDIRVDSALNEPLSAQIDIVGATRDELAALTAKVANREMFQRYGADRPSFLASATFKVGLDAQGRPVLNVRSSESFTDPVVNFLVDLRWGKGELIREYSLLLDPAGFAVPAQPQAQLQAPTPPAAAPVAPVASTSSVDAPPTPAIASQHRVVARDTLRSIARRAGARTESQAQRTMIAIFRANPQAFAGNINVLHLGALLSIPSTQDIAAVDGADAKREVRAHMTAWRLDGRPAPQRAAAVPATLAVPTAETVALNDRVQSLEKALDDVHQQLAVENAKIQDLKQLSAAAPVTVTPVAVTPVPVAPVVERMRVEEHPAPVLAAVVPSPAQPLIGKALVGSIAAGLALLLGGFAYMRRRVSGSGKADSIPAEEPRAPSVVTRAEAEHQQQPAAVESKAVPIARVHERPAPVAAEAIVAREIQPRAQSNEFDDTMGIDTVALERSYLDSLGVDTFGIDETAPHQAVDDDAAERELAQTAAHEVAAIETAAHDVSEMHTVALDVSELDAATTRADLNTAVLDTSKLDSSLANGTVLDYNLLDLDATTQHVHMSSDQLDEPLKDRRTNIVDVLKTAIERDPERRDLRMKLLETYFSAASTNQRGFLEMVRKLSREPNTLSADDWQKIVMMGRAIAPDDILFVDQAKDNLANCA